MQVIRSTITGPRQLEKWENHMKHSVEEIIVLLRLSKLSTFLSNSKQLI